MSNYRLTPRGERVLAAAYTVLITAGAALVLLAMIGFAGWIEGL